MKYLFLSLVLFYGCATPYQQKGFRGGYEEIALEDGVFLVTAEGNGYTSKTSVLNIAYRRAKELCPNGFVDLGRDDSADVHIGSNFNGTGIQTYTRHYYALKVKCKN